MRALERQRSEDARPSPPSGARSRANLCSRSFQDYSDLVGSTLGYRAGECTDDLPALSTEFIQLLFKPFVRDLAPTKDHPCRFKLQYMVFPNHLPALSTEFIQLLFKPFVRDLAPTKDHPCRFKL